MAGEAPRDDDAEEKRGGRPSALRRLLAWPGLRGVSGTVALRVTGAGLGFLSHVVYARLLGRGDYGVFAYYWVWVVVLGTLAQLGLATANTRFVAQYLERHRLARLLVLLRFGMLAPLAAGGLLGLGFLLLDRWTNPWVVDHGEAAGVIAALCVPLFALGESMRGYARGLGWVVLAYRPAFLDRPLFALLFAALVQGMLGHISVTLLLGAYLAALAVSTGRQLHHLHHRSPARSAGRRPRLHSLHARGWLSASLPLVIVDGYFIMAANLDVIVLKYFVQPADLAAYFAATKIAAIANFLPAAAAAQAAPSLARLWQRGERSSLRRLSHRYALLAFLPTLAVFAALAAFGDVFLKIYGAGFERSHLAMVIITGGILAQSFAGPVRYLLAMTGHEAPLAMAMAASALFNLVFNLALIPAFGLAGAAVATALSTIGFTTLLSLQVRRHLGFWPGPWKGI